MTPPPLPQAELPALAEALSARQRDCLALAARGLSSSAIGERLGISGRTVDEHLMRACQALGVWGEGFQPEFATANCMTHYFTSRAKSA